MITTLIIGLENQRQTHDNPFGLGKRTGGL